MPGLQKAGIHSNRYLVKCCVKYCDPGESEGAGRSLPSCGLHSSRETVLTMAGDGHEL